MDLTANQLNSTLLTLKAAGESLRDASDPDPVDLAAVLTGLREVAWAFDSVVKGLSQRFVDVDRVGHDSGGSSEAAVTLIGRQLADVAYRFEQIDTVFDHAHLIAVKLHRRRN
jgi:hypothetical protein